MLIFLAGAWSMGSHEEVHDMQVEEFKHKLLLKHKPKIIVHKPVIVVPPPPPRPVVHVVPKKVKLHKLHKG